jgi:MoaA/NifB/PqqE/SkfB family radical SAM enzyme
LLTGGEPLMRKNDIIRLCEKYRGISFAAFTNGTLIDEALADAAARLENLNFYLSIEGWREDTDYRRGAGVFDQVVRAMDILRSRNIGFGFSACYHARNCESVASDEFLDFLREKGCWFGWLFQYVPVGNDADPSLVCTPEQRESTQARLADYSRRHDMMLIDFWNNGHLGFGCLGAGTGFAHINAKGDIEPCAFCHYADSNIYDVSLAEALRSPFFRGFRRAMPYSDNPLAGCPLLNQPDTLAGVVRQTGAWSTHLGHPETVEALAAKTRPAAQAWRPVADRLFAGYSPEKKRNFRSLLRYLNIKKRLIDG